MQMRCKEETAKGAYLWGHPEGDKHFGFAQVIADCSFMIMHPQQTRRILRKRTCEKIAEGGARKICKCWCDWLGHMTVLGLAPRSLTCPALCSPNSVSLAPQLRSASRNQANLNHVNHKPFFVKCTAFYNLLVREESTCGSKQVIGVSQHPHWCINYYPSAGSAQCRAQP